jgi:glycosyltransferase involved in cell wall biosynthesis
MYGPLIIFHGLQSHRKGFKGSYIIEAAFDRLNKKYPAQLKCICAGDMSYAKYKSLLANAHIIVDQTNFISYGMNALLSMSMGKVVCSGSQDKTYYDRWLPLTGITEYPPIVPLKPDVDFIVEQIEALLLGREKLIEISKNGRAFVEKYHDAKNVALMFMERWGVNRLKS